ncbi:hypothetical protein [Rheinheimera aquimaris]|uniref:hypothetical protein n=1 Tax=Rheinheimera aquimaris TaxID=412437 RepID=UPI003A9835D9
MCLLPKSSSGNRLIAKLTGKESAPTEAAWIHIAATFAFLFVAGLTLPPKDDSTKSNSFVATPMKPNATGSISLESANAANDGPPSCIKARLVDAKSLWAQLKQARYNPEFHKFGFGQGGPFGNWELARKEGYELYNKCQNSLGGPLKYKFIGLAESYSYLHYVGKDWYQTSGKGKSNTQDFIDMIEFALANDGKAK